MSGGRVTAGAPGEVFGCVRCDNDLPPGCPPGCPPANGPVTAVSRALRGRRAVTTPTGHCWNHGKKGTYKAVRISEKQNVLKRCDDLLCTVKGTRLV